MEVVIRRAVAEDFAELNRVARQGQDEHADSLPHIFARCEHPFGREFFDSLFASEQFELLVAVQGERLVGFSLLEALTDPGLYSLVPRKYAYVRDFGVDTEVQRQGIGRKLMAASVDWAKEQGAEQLDLKVWEFNEQAIRFYESLGMKTIARTMSVTL
ncbi:acetyltransferase (GNAT) family protein [Tumebacillus sp. BK434]|uniref:GNAT family N-acetyltransferase n=1 Tax=Tumebacillus sp. BK434 TaxID=2512169 RepID=UPI00104D9035|nr:GNAT family N-acetyltransferase [Tumebacillus sp. BK434]TCP58200.1 acetyltransferase (GNAT) family protein [Tumebacillus sp. BK434]